MPLTPFLMFTGQAEEAVRFYVSVFPDAEILELARYGSDGAGPDGGIKGITFRLAEGGSVLIPPGGYPFATRFAWLNDRYGVSWQLSAGPG